MNPAVTLAVYAGTLALLFGAAVGVGGAVGPVGTATDDMTAHGSADGPAGQDAGGPSGEHAAGQDAGDLAPGGLAVSQDGYALQLVTTVQAPGEPGQLQFGITGPDGARVTGFRPEHDKELHLIVVRRDLTGFQHVHPERDTEGLWSVPLTLAEPGPYKVFADFVPAERGEPLTLAADLTAPGTYAPQPAATPSRATQVDGYDVSLEGDLVAGTSSELTLDIARDGRPVTDLQPYLGAYGHLVALREGDLAYLHVHPDGALDDPETRPGPDIPFSADVPSAATYRLFLDFSHAGAVRTAAFTATATGRSDRAPDADPAGAPSPHSSSPHDH